jgi:hypothetical protein
MKKLDLKIVSKIPALCAPKLNPVPLRCWEACPDLYKPDQRRWKKVPMNIKEEIEDCKHFLEVLKSMSKK